MECVKRLLVADASQEFRCHLVESFQNEPDMEVVGETGDGLQLLELTQKLLPDVIVMEMVLSGLDGLEVLEAVCRTALYTEALGGADKLPPQLVQQLGRKAEKR